MEKVFFGKSAVIDVGSNSVRLMLVADGKVLYKMLNTTRLGEGLAFSPRLKSEAQERTASAIAEFKTRAAQEGATKIYAFATAAVREAENKEEFLALAKAKSGLDLDVVAGQEEATLGINGALKNCDGAMIDIGGASTEIAVKISGQIVYKKSVPLGVVRLKDMCGRNAEEIDKVCSEKASKFKDVIDWLYSLQENIVAIGGTATTLGAIKADLQEYDGQKLTGAMITRAEMSQYAENLLTMPIEKIEKLPCMPKKRADVIGGGAAWLAKLMDFLSIPQIVISDEDNLEGYAMQKGLL